MKKPRDSVQFERMVCRCAEMRMWKANPPMQYFSLLGRSGKKQYGGDIHSEDWTIIIQCKCYDQNKKDSYKRVFNKIKEDYSKACGYYDKMQTFVIATTLDRRRKTQEDINKFKEAINNLQKEQGIKILTLFWEDLESLYLEFEEKYKLAEIRQILGDRLIRERNSHPSFQLMRADEIDARLFPKYEGVELEARTGDDDDCISPIWQRVRKSWEDRKNRSIVIEGEGGIGKTVALFSLTMAKKDYEPAPAVYIPLYKLVDVSGDCKDIPEYLEHIFPALYQELDQLTSREWDDGPGLLLLLDGFNEIPGDKRRRVLQSINVWMDRHAGAQLIAVSRPMDNINLERELAGDPIGMKLLPLDRERAKDFLWRNGLPIPPGDAPIWKNLVYPLFLILYAKTGKLKNVKSFGYRLDMRTAKNGGELIWNYLQREMLRIQNKDWPWRCAFATEYITPYIAYRMLKENQFEITRGQVQPLIDEALEHYNAEALPRHLHEVWMDYDFQYEEFPPIQNISKKDWYKMVLRDTGVLIGKTKGDTKDKDVENYHARKTNKDSIIYVFMHQNFRDALAGLHLVNHAEMAQENELPDIWKYYQNHLALNYAADLMDDKTADKLWEANRTTQQRSKPGTKPNHAATSTLLELIKRRNAKEQVLDFSGMDLRGYSLTKHLGDDDSGLPLFRKAELSCNTKLDKATFLSEGHHDSIECLVCLSNGRIVSGSVDCTLRIWDDTTVKCLKTLKGHTDTVTCISVLLDGRIVSGSKDDTLRVWDTENEECLETFEGHNNLITDISVLSDRRVVSGSYDKTLRIWDTETGKCLKTPEGHSSHISGISVLPDGRIISRSWNDILRVWDIETGKCVKTIKGHTGDIICITVLLDGRVVSGSYDKTLRVWDTETGECLKRLEGHSNLITAISVLPDGCIVSGSYDKTLRVWNTETGECLKTLEGHTGYVACISVLPDGRIVSGSLDDPIRIWDTETGACLKTLEGHTRYAACISVLPDGRIVSGSWDDTMRIWDTETGACLKTLEGHTRYVTCISVFPDGRIVSGSYDNTMRIWNIETGECMQTLKGHTGAVLCISILPDGRIVSGSKDGTMRIWDIDRGISTDVLEATEVDVSQMDFSQAILTQEIAKILWRNSAKISDSDYEKYVKHIQPDTKP